MKILIVGAGGVGGYICAKLIECDKDVTLLATEKTKNIIQKNGLKVIDVDKEITVKPKLNLEGKYDIVFITTKYYDLDEVIDEIKPFINNDTLIVPILNGIKHFEKLKIKCQSIKILYLHFIQ